MTATVQSLLQPLKDRLAAATPGPWEWDDKVRRGLWRQGESTPVLGCSALLHPGKSDSLFIAHAPTDQAKLIAAIESAEQSFIGRAESYRETADRLNQQVIDRDPDRDPETAARYSHYASAAESALQVFRIAITQALGGDTA